MDKIFSELFLKQKKSEFSLFFFLEKLNFAAPRLSLARERQGEDGSGWEGPAEPDPSSGAEGIVLLLQEHSPCWKEPAP